MATLVEYFNRQSNKVNVMWTQGDVSVVNDAFYTLIKTATGWSTSAMSAFYTACAARSY